MSFINATHYTWPIWVQKSQNIFYVSVFIIIWAEKKLIILEIPCACKTRIVILSMLVLQRNSSQVNVVKLDICPHLVIVSRYHNGSRMVQRESNNGAQFLFSVTSDFQKYLALIQKLSQICRRSIKLYFYSIKKSYWQFHICFIL